MNGHTMREVARAMSPAKLFAVLAFTLGLGYVLINPPFAVNDEDVHLARIYEFASGRLVTRSDEHGEYHSVPNDLRAYGAAYQGIPQGRNGGRVKVRRLWTQLTTHEDEPIVRMHARASNYSPFAYHLQIAAVFLCARLKIGALPMLYITRVVSLSVYVFLGFHAVRLAGGLCWLFSAIGLMPMALTQAAGVSGDGIVLGLSLLFFALIARGSLWGEAPPSPRALALLLLCLTVLTLAKPVYVLEALALPVLRWPTPRANLRRFAFAALGLGLAAGGYMIWASLLDQGQAANDLIEGSTQVTWLKENPLRIVRVAATTALRFVDDLLIQSIFVRYRIAQGMRFAGGSVSVLYAFLLLGLAVGASRRAFIASERARKLVCAGLILCALAIVCGVPSGLYLCCNKIGNSAVKGFHGRYLIPAFPPFLLALTLVGRPVLGRWLRQRPRLRVMGAIVLANFVCYFSLIGWHYFSERVAWPL